MSAPQNYTMYKINSPFLGLPFQSDIWLALPIHRRLALMLCPVEHIGFTSDCLGGNEFWVLGHITRAIHFAGMVDCLDGADSGRGSCV